LIDYNNYFGNYIDAIRNGKPFKCCRYHPQCVGLSQC
jgi:hypothetical protein